MYAFYLFCLLGNSLTELKKKYPPYPADRIRAWDWTGTDITKESQKAAKRTDSVQFRVIQELMNGDYNILFDDDDKGEAADVVGIHVGDHSINVELYHCKFSGAGRPGARLGDLYVVCGQAQKCVHLMDDPTKLFRHLLRRDAKAKGGRASRFERGDQAELLKITEMSRALPTYLTVYIVQPGLSKGNVTVDLLELLSVTENYLMETYKIPFCVIASP